MAEIVTPSKGNKHIEKNSWPCLRPSGEQRLAGYGWLEIYNFSITLHLQLLGFSRWCWFTRAKTTIYVLWTYRTSKTGCQDCFEDLKNLGAIFLSRSLHIFVHNWDSFDMLWVRAATESGGRLAVTWCELVTAGLIRLLPRTQKGLNNLDAVRPGLAPPLLWWKLESEVRVIIASSAV